jgi:hypothetical protein
MGAGHWEERYSKALKGRHVRIIPDRDQPSRARSTPWRSGARFTRWPPRSRSCACPMCPTTSRARAAGAMTRRKPRCAAAWGPAHVVRAAPRLDPSWAPQAWHLLGDPREAPPSREAHSVDSNHNGKDLQ